MHLLLLMACATSTPPTSTQTGSWTPADTGSGAAVGTTAGDTDTGGPTDTSPPEDTGPVVSIEEDGGCDSLNPRHCLLPWPSDRYLVADAGTVTGWRLHYEPGVIPKSDLFEQELDLTPFERLDGFSPSSQIMTLFPKTPTLDGVAGHEDIARSLEPDSPTVILDLETGERVAHWVEVDDRSDDPADTVVYLRLATALPEDHDVAVAIRGLAGSDGAPFQADPAFAALRDGQRTDSESLEARRPDYEAMFSALEGAGVARDSLQLAWRFHTASGEAMRGDMLTIRADALERLGDEGIGCVVSSIEDDYSGDGVSSFRRVRGTVTVPSYMDSPDPPAAMTRDADGTPIYSEDVEVNFTAVIPYSVADAGAPGPLLTWGHGLLGSGEDDVSKAQLRQVAESSQVVMIATNWAGMSVDDIPAVAAAFTDVSQFYKVAERLQQGMINQIAMTRTLAGVCRNQSAFTVDGVSVIDPSRLYYAGGSLGGILGGSLVTLSPDIDRGVLFVNGAVFPFMIERSTQYEPYFPYFEAAYPRRADRAVMLPLAQHLWDASEPAGYLAHAAAGLDGIGPKQLLSIAALNDAQVPNLSTDVAMRMVGAPVVRGSVREPWGFEVRDAPFEGSAYVTLDVGDPAVPEGNTAPEDDFGGHGSVGYTDTSLLMSFTFLSEGRVIFPSGSATAPPPTR